MNASAPPVVMIPKQWITQTKNSSWESPYLWVHMARARACLPAFYFLVSLPVLQTYCQSHHFKVRVGGPKQTCFLAVVPKNNV